MGPRDALDVFALVGLMLQMAVAYGILIGAGMIQFQWRCGLCGKMNEGNLIKFMLQWCNHTPDQ